ncbi:MAG: hypothetical protein IJS56_00365 [Bacilli bacterium]|nr:hypothetical protein [Bacilli bacterium]
MLNIITTEVPIEDELKERIEFACKYLNIKCIIKNGFIHSIDKTNLCYIEPNMIIIKNTIFFAFNHSRDIFVRNLEKKLKFSEFQEYIKSL